MKHKNLFIVILAGGSGTRFWPMSRASKPKQFLNIMPGGTLLQQTIERVKSRVPGQNVFIITNKGFRKDIIAQTKSFRIPSANILYEPSGKNTAPAICWAAAKIQKVNSEAIMAVLPSDHLISNKRDFLSVLAKAQMLAEHNHLVTLGIKPTRPETGYGYLKTSTKKVDGTSIVVVDKFTEKPNLARAKKFYKNKNYFWNSGMFIWKTSVILEEFKSKLPSVYKNFMNNKNATLSDATIRQNWKKLPSISIDYGILEKAKNVVAVPAQKIGWSDLGSWESLMDVLQKDKNGNVLRGQTYPITTKNSFLWSEKKLLATIGLDDIIVIDMPDALLVCRKDLSQDVRCVVDLLKKHKRSDVV